MNFFGADTSASPSRATLDRRAADRFPIEREVRFKMLSKRHGSDVGLGTTLNMSSSGVLFTTDRALLPGQVAGQIPACVLLVRAGWANPKAPAEAAPPDLRIFVHDLIEQLFPRFAWDRATGKVVLSEGTATLLRARPGRC
jgi:hypothetical protein